MEHIGKGRGVTFVTKAELESIMEGMRDFVRSTVKASEAVIMKEIKKLSGDVALLQHAVTEHTKAIKRLEADVQLLKEDVRALKEDVRVLKEDVRVLKEDVRVLKEDVRMLKLDVSKINAHLDDHEHRIAVLEGSH